MYKRIRTTITGRVQGVGFRPTVYRYAMEHTVSGFVKNAPEGVIIEAEGEEENLIAFMARITEAPPRQALIETASSQDIPATGEPGFHIIPSQGSGDLLVGMPPDLATCEACGHELFDRDNRRFRYPFLNCTNCGPRFTIITRLPYDRDTTSMKIFEMCPDCRREYTDPTDRRFDAQPNACSQCGPSLQLIDTSRTEISGDPIAETVERLSSGNIVAIKGLGGYHLCCDATNDSTVTELRIRKNRPSKSLAVMFSSIDEIRDHCLVTGQDEDALLSVARPIVIVPRHKSSTLPHSLSPDTNTIGAFLPYTPLHHLLLTAMHPLVMTSGNRAEEPIVKDEEELDRILGTIADYALTHNRPILRRCDDSVMQTACGKRLFIRRSRGFVPDSITLPYDSPSILACGGELKNTFCITRGRQAFLSQYIGDLTEYRAYTFFRESIDDLKALLQVSPALVAHDMHPDYESTHYALKATGMDTMAIQHHHAHIASCMSEYAVTEPVIGVALDGTGYGPDRTVWGGEFLVADLCDFHRAAHFKQYPLPGGDAAVLHPIRMALSCCLSEYGNTIPPLLMSRFETELKDELPLLTQIIEKRTHSPLTSSCGRLFDAVSALLGLCSSITYEGQAAVRLQFAASAGITDTYSYTIEIDPHTERMLSFGPMIREIVADLADKRETGIIAAQFHSTVAAAVAEMSDRIRQEENINRVVLSGGVFQNALLLSMVVDALNALGFNVFYHTRVPPNDGGVALGQAAIANALYHVEGK